MVMHIFGLRWKAEATVAQKGEALAQIRAFPQHIPGIQDLHAGPNVSQQGQGFETVGVMRFADQAALAAYLRHPVHQAFVASVRDWIEAVDLDLEMI